MKGIPRTPALLAWLRLTRVANKLGRIANERLSGAGISKAQFIVLANVGSTEGITQQDLAEQLSVTQGNICQLLDKMEKAGLIVRQREGHSNRLYLTEHGQAVFDDVAPAHEALITEQMAALPREKQMQLHQLLRELDRSLPDTPKTGCHDS